MTEPVIQLVQPKTEMGDRVIPILERLLAEAKDGDVTDIAVAVVRPGRRSMWTWSGAQASQSEILLFPLLDLVDLVRAAVRDAVCHTTTDDPPAADDDE